MQTKYSVISSSLSDFFSLKRGWKVKAEQNNFKYNEVLLLWAEALNFYLDIIQMLMQRPQFMLLAFNY